MAKRLRSAAQIKADMARLTNELALSEAREGERIGNLAVKAGLHEIECTEADLTAAFRDLAVRFRTASKQSDKTA